MKLLKNSTKISSLARRTFLRNFVGVSVGTSIFLIFGLGSLPMALAQSTNSETALVTVVQHFGYDATNDGDKVLIQLGNGEQYFVWYYTYDNPIIPKIGSVMKLTYRVDNYGSVYDLYELINTGTGKQTRVLRFAKAN